MSKQIEATCLNCNHSVFDEQWGEYKCKKKTRVCTESELQMGCSSWEKNGAKPNEPKPEIVTRSGATFTPHVSDSGVLSWTNDKGLDNPKQVNIKGPKGDPGAPGVPGKDGVDGKDGEPGAPGKDGLDGKNGYTPVKGVDYFDGEPGKDGVDGKDGKDGFSPVVEVEAIDGGHRVSVTDSKGTSSFDVRDGEDGAGGGGAAIIDVTELPTGDIREDCFYRLLSASCVAQGTYLNTWVVHCVETLPEVGESATTDMVNFIVYYNKSDNDVYGYLNDALGASIGAPAGWYPLSVLCPAVGTPWGGVITDIRDSIVEDTSTLFVLLENVVYSYKSGWTSGKTIGWSGTGNGAEIFNHPANIASGGYSHAEGYYTTADGMCSHAEGSNTTADGMYSHAEGNETTASGGYSHAEGYRSHAEGNRSHAEGSNTTASGTISHAEGYETTASGHFSHAEGWHTTASGDFSHAEGNETTASCTISHAEGDLTTASGDSSHAEGSNTTADGISSHAEGVRTTASGHFSHAEGSSTTASAYASHAEGYSTTASGYASHAEGYSTTASGENQHVQGKYNVEDTESKYAHIVGNGEYVAPSNAHTLDWEGNAWFAGSVEGTALILKSPNGTRFRITVDDSGTLSTEKITE